MNVVRRLYLYVVSFIALAAFVAGVQELLSSLVSSIVDSAFHVLAEGSVTRQQTSLAIALIVVGLPVWLIHWTVAQRMARGATAAAADERASSIRALYLGLVRFVSVVALAIVAIAIANIAVSAVTGESVDLGSLGDLIAGIVTAAAVWLYHQRVATADAAAGADDGIAASWNRFYRYGVAYLALAGTLAGVASLIALAVDVVFAEPDLFGTSPAVQAARVAAAVAVGLVVWAVHWRMSERRARPAAASRDDERMSTLRAAYVGGVIALCGFVAVTSLVDALYGLGSLVLGLGNDNGVSTSFGLVVIAPALAAVVYVVVGWLHDRARVRETEAIGPELAASARRLRWHLLALIGLVFAAVGLQGVLVAVFDGLSGSQMALSGANVLEAEIAWRASQLIVGAALWLPAWVAILRAREVAPERESQALTARAYLYLAVGVSLVATVVSAVAVVYRGVDLLLAGGAVSDAVDWAPPVATLIVAGGIAAYHARLVVADLRSARAAPASAETVAVTPDTPVAGPVGLALLLSGPAGLDLDALAASLRDGLPPGVTLERA
jgi:hypothetical protein